jgi:hypothetical protein
MYSLMIVGFVAIIAWVGTIYFIYFDKDPEPNKKK